MLFNSYEFIFLFLPLTLVVYFLLCRTKDFFAKIWLLLMSLVFYGYFNASYLLIISTSILLNFVFSHALLKCEKEKIRKLLFALALLFNLGILIYYKYSDFIRENINLLFHSSLPLQHLLLPLGISFFTFQQLSYVIDSYKREVPAYHFVDYALFVTFFPQLIAGPIVTHDEIVPQFANPANKKLDFNNFSKGLMAFAFGLFKKVVLADTLGNAVNWGYQNTASLDSTNAIIVVLCYTFQLYFDFSGYCDMASGIGLMFNITLPMNFNSPYKALNMVDFWKRWHMTLTRFFTKYVYIPLGGNRKGTVRRYVNVFIIFLVSGLWHGANWTFILWGAVHGILNVFTQIFKKTIDRIPKWINWIITFILINLTWIIFRADSIHQAWQMISNIFKFQFGTIQEGVYSPFHLPEIIGVLLLFGKDIRILMPALPMLFFIGFSLFSVLKMKNTHERIVTFTPSRSYLWVSVLLLIWAVLSLPGVNTFLYFNF